MCRQYYSAPHNASQQTHLLERVITVVSLAGSPRGVDHHEVEHAVAAKLVEPLLPYCLFGVIGECAKRPSAAARPGLHHESVVQEPAAATRVSTKG
jgi:hypothetical protein